MNGCWPGLHLGVAGTGPAVWLEELGVVGVWARDKTERVSGLGSKPHHFEESFRPQGPLQSLPDRVQTMAADSERIPACSLIPTPVPASSGQDLNRTSKRRGQKEGLGAESDFCPPCSPG